jgi:hypothetical protein
MYESSTDDDNISSAGSVGVAAGLHISTRPAYLIFKITERFNACIDIRIYHSNRQVFRSFRTNVNDPLKWEFIEAPTSHLTGKEKKNFIELRSSSAVANDPLEYNLEISYLPAERRLEGRW